ncbi:hypothetical protein [Caulobacter endophyticus]|uniref:hypothetical protein n=1 Tax=Caulobacter endophyticus TaxID=2172652 RepID=UPI002410A05C|nr:hypothetical protein [Caulobacter endophyticus]MDG2529647.1 hypothetical protein [Caulobacter endophyticus]
MTLGANIGATHSSAWRGLAAVVGGVATAIAVSVAAIVAVVFAATLVVVGFMATALLGLAAFALRGRRHARAKASSDPNLIEARNVGGHSWVAYGWNERR